MLLNIKILWKDITFYPQFQKVLTFLDYIPKNQLIFRNRGLKKVFMMKAASDKVEG